VESDREAPTRKGPSGRTVAARPGASRGAKSSNSHAPELPVPVVVAEPELEDELAAEPEVDVEADVEADEEADEETVEAD
jgi:hypothetical protein